MITDHSRDYKLTVFSYELLPEYAILAVLIHSDLEDRSCVVGHSAHQSRIESDLEFCAERFASVMDLNVNAMMNGILPTVAIMKEQGGGCILNTSSMVSICGQPGGVAYPSSKYAVNGLTWSLARELGPFHIRVNAVAPGITRTDMVAALPKEMIDPLINRIPLRRIGEAEDIANAFLFLASDMASYVTGEILSVDGAMRS